MNFLQVKDLNRREGLNLIARDISFTQSPLEKLAIAGETGSGKSTVLKMIGGLVQPNSGEVIFEGERIPGPFEKLIPGHPKIGYLSQQFELPNHFSVHEVMELVNRSDEIPTEKLYRLCRINHLMQRKTSQLSGGERQRIALARVLSTAPKLLLLDEPFSNLDLLHKSIIRQVITDIGNELGITCLLVSHDVTDILSWADRAIMMKDASIIQEGSPELIYHQPVNEYVAALFGEYNLIDLESQAFLSLQSRFQKGKKLFIRPEEIKIHEDGEFKAVIRRRSFRGNFNLFEGLIGDKSIWIQSANNEFQSGDEIHISIVPVMEWHLG